MKQIGSPQKAPFCDLAPKTTKSIQGYGPKKNRRYKLDLTRAPGGYTTKD